MPNETEKHLSDARKNYIICYMGYLKARRLEDRERMAKMSAACACFEADIISFERMLVSRR